MKDIKEKNFENTEQLTPEELKNVAGGSCEQLFYDSYELNALGLCRRYGHLDLCLNPGHCQDVINAWKKAGVDVKFHDITGNEYYINGKRVSRDEAVAFIKKK